MFSLENQFVLIEVFCPMINKQTEFLKGRQHTPQLSVFKRPLIRGINNVTKDCFPSTKHFHNVVLHNTELKIQYLSAYSSTGNGVTKSVILDSSLEHGIYFFK